VAPAPSRALQPAVEPGSRLAGRYRLTEQLPPAEGDPDDASRWQAVDDVLARPVEVLVLLAGGRRAPGARALLDAAAAAGTVVSPVLAQVYDAALEQVPAQRYGRAAGTVDVAFVVSEAVRGRTLAELLADDGPLDPGDAGALARRAAQGLAAAHARGVAHGALHPGTVLVTNDGPRLLDAAVAAALDRRRRTTPPDPVDDVLALVGCLYAALTARWPEREVGGMSGGLRPAPLTGGREGRTCSPRQVRAGVPRALEAVVVRGLGDDRFGSAQDLLSALHRADDLDAAARTPAPRRPRPALPPVVRRLGSLVLVAVLLVVIGVVSYGSGREFGSVQQEDGALEALVDSTPSPVPGDTGQGERLDLLAPGVLVTAFDPPPGDGTENNGAVPNSVDGDPATAWDTENYDTAQFGGLKSGVGLLVDLGEPVTVRQVELGLRPGTGVELRAGPPDAAAPPGSADDLPVVATVADTEAVARLVPDAPVTTRFLLVWITRLPPDDERFRSGISELQVVRD
jgi:hypothetical protein